MPEDARKAKGIELADNFVVVVGPPDTGKSNLVKHLLRLDEYRKHLVWDPLYGFDPEEVHVVRPPTKAYRYRRYEEGNPELNKAVQKFVLDQTPTKRPDYLVIEECGRMLPNGQPEGPAIGELNDYNAHYGVSVWLLGQRLAQINTDLENKATHYFVTGFQGKNDKQAFRDIHEELPERLEEAKKEDPYAFAYAGSNGVLRIFESVPVTGADKSEL